MGVNSFFIKTPSLKRDQEIVFSSPQPASHSFPMFTLVVTTISCCPLTCISAGKEQLIREGHYFSVAIFSQASDFEW